MMPPNMLVPWLTDCLYFDPVLFQSCFEVGTIVMCAGTAAGCLAMADEWQYQQQLAWMAMTQSPLPFETVPA